MQTIFELGWNLTGIYDINPESMEISKKELEQPNLKCYLDLNLAFSESKPDLVIIASTADTHCDLTRFAATHGARYILVEKPMATSVADCNHMIKVCKDNNVTLAVNHQMRFMSVYSEPKKLIGSDEFGELCSMTLVAGNIGFSMNGGHCIEALRSLTNETLLKVSATFPPELIPKPREPQFEDQAGSLRLITPKNKILNMEIGSNQSHRMQLTYSYERGIVVVDEVAREMFTSCRLLENRGPPSTRVGKARINSRHGLPFCGAIETTALMLQAMVSGFDYVPGEQGRSVVQALALAYQSARQGRKYLTIEKRDVLNEKFSGA
jgi:predicted dehydrogenase